MIQPLLSADWHRVASLRPRLRLAVRVRRQAWRGRRWYLLCDEATGRQHLVNEAAYGFIGRCDGSHDVQAVWDAVLDDDADAAPTQPEVIELLVRLDELDLLQCGRSPDAEVLFQRRDQRRGLRRRSMINPFSFRLSLGDPWRWLPRLDPIAHALFRPALLWWWLTLVTLAALVAAANWDGLVAHGRQLFGSPRALVLAWLCFPVMKALHELGHALAVRRWGGDVHEIGIGLMLLVPAPYVDASAASAFERRGQRASVAAAGIVVELALAAFAVLFWVAAQPGSARDIAFVVMSIGGISTLAFNGNRFVAAIDEEVVDQGRGRDAARPDSRTPHFGAGTHRLAVLPFHNQTGRPDLAWFDLGLMSTTIDALASAPGLSVVPATDLLAVVGAQNPSIDLQAAAQKIAQALGAADLVQVVVKVGVQGVTTLEYQGWGPRLGTLTGSLGGFDPIVLCRQMAKQIQAHLSPDTTGSGTAGAPKEIARDAQFAHVAHSRALHAIHIERWDLARTLLRVALDIVPDDIGIRLDYARCLVWQRDPRVAPLLEQALQQSRSAHDPALEVRALHLYATYLHGTGKLDEAERLLSEALKIAEAQQDQETELQLLVSIGQTLANGGRTAVAAWMIDRAAQLAGALGNRVATARLLDVRGRIATIKGDDRAAMAAFADAASLSEQYGIFATASFSVTHVGNCLVNVGQMIAAADCFERAFQYACQSGSPVSVGMAGCYAVRYGGLRRGDVAHAGSILDKMRDMNGASSLLVQGCADFAESFVMARNGQLEASCRLLEKAESKLASSRSFAFHAAKHRARTLVCLGRLDEASDLCETIENRVTGRLKRPAMGAVTHCRGLIARASGHDAEALTLLRETLAELPASIDRVEAALDAAWLVLEAGDLDAARQVLSGLEDFMAAALTSEYGAAMLLQARLHFAAGDATAAATLQRRYCAIMSCSPESSAHRCMLAFEQAARSEPIQPVPRVPGLPSLFELMPGMGCTPTRRRSR